MKIQLQVIAGPGEKVSKTFDQPCIKLGRGDWNDMVFNDPSQRMVSRNHAEIRLENDQPGLFDLQSSFGTYVNGKQITQAELHSSEVIQLGTHGPEIKISWGAPSQWEQDSNRTVMVGSSSGFHIPAPAYSPEPPLPPAPAPVPPPGPASVPGGAIAPPAPKATMVVSSSPGDSSAISSLGYPPPASPGAKATVVYSGATAPPPAAPGAKATVVYTGSEASAPAAPPSGSKATVVMDPSAEAVRPLGPPPSSTPPRMAAPPKQGIGKETMAVIVDEAIKKERDKIRAEAGASGNQAAQASVGKLRTLVIGGGALLGIFMLAAFILFFKMQDRNRQLQSQIENQSQQIAELLKLNATAQQQVEEKQKQLQAELQKVLDQKDAEAKQKEAAIRAEIDAEKKKLDELQKKASALQAWNDKVKTDQKSTQEENKQLASVGEGTAVLIFCRYTVGEITNDSSGSGFLVSADGRVVTAKQVIEPWKFDPAVAFYQKSAGAGAGQVKQEIYIWKKDAKVSQGGQPNLSAAFSTVAGSVAVIKIAGDDMESQNYQPEEGPGKVAVRVHRASSESNLALLQIRGGSGLAVARVESASPAKGEAVVSFGYPIGVEQPVARPELLRAALADSGAHLRLDKTTPPGFIGAPVFNSAGAVIGMVISQDYVIPASAIARLVR